MTKFIAFLIFIGIGMAANQAKSQSFTFVIASPSLNELSDSVLDINVQYYTSTFALSNITAVSEGRVDTLYNAGSGGGYINFNGSIKLSGLTQGDTLKLKVTCRDAMGNQQSDSVKYIYANKPLCAVVAPADWSSAMYSLHIKTWHDGANPTLIMDVRVGTQTIFSHTSVGNDIDTTLQLSSALNGTGFIRLSVQDRWGRSFNSGVSFIADSYLNYIYMTPVYTGTGKVLDYNYNKILEARNDAVYIVDSGFQTASAIPGTYTIPTAGTLTEYGAVWNNREWTNGVLYNNTYKSAAGKYAIYTAPFTEEFVGTGFDLFRRNLSTRNDVFVVRTYDNNLTSSTIYPDGTVIHFLNYNEAMGKCKVGSSSYYIDITSQPYGIGAEFVSGDTIIYTKTNFENLSSVAYMHDGTTKTVLNDFGGTYRIAGKYIAYANRGAAGESQIWLRDSTGNSVQRTFFGSSSYVAGLNPLGDMLFTNDSKLYFLKKDSINPREIGPSVGTPFYKDTAWYVIKNNVLYQINTNAYRTTASGNWSNPNSWRYGSVPLPNANVIVDTNITVDTNVICNTLTVIPPGSVTVAPGINLTVLH